MVLRKTRMKIRKLLLIIGLFTLTHASPITTLALADSVQAGITLTFPVISQDPSNLHGYRGSIWYQPNIFTCKHFQLYFDAAYAHYRVNYSAWGTNSLSIYSVSPIARFYFLDNSPKIRPFIDLSIGLSYLSKTRLADRRFGTHFAFQDLM